MPSHIELASSAPPTMAPNRFQPSAVLARGLKRKAVAKMTPLKAIGIAESTLPMTARGSKSSAFSELTGKTNPSSSASSSRV